MKLSDYRSTGFIFKDKNSWLYVDESQIDKYVDGPVKSGLVKLLDYYETDKLLLRRVSAQGILSCGMNFEEVVHCALAVGCGCLPMVTAAKEVILNAVDDNNLYHDLLRCPIHTLTLMGVDSVTAGCLSNAGFTHMSNLLGNESALVQNLWGTAGISGKRVHLITEALKDFLSAETYQKACGSYAEVKA